MALTNDPALARTMELLRSHGVTRDDAMLQSSGEGAWYYEQRALGFNFRMTDIQAALGTSQAVRLDQFIARRRALAASYDSRLSDLPVILPWQDPSGQSSWHLYIVQVDEKACGSNRKAVFDGLRQRGIGVNVHYIPIYLQPYYERLGFRPGRCPEAEAYYRRAISIPLHAGLSDDDQDWVIAALDAELVG